MTYIVKKQPPHHHRWFIDANTGDYVCMCGTQKGREEKKAKYHNKSTVYNGTYYHSKFEAGYAANLDWLVKSKEIKSWERQVKLDLRVNGQHITNYYIDFVVHHFDGSREFVECKGYETGEWQIKWRLFEALFDDFKDHPDDSMVLVKETSWGPLRKRA